MTTRKIRKTALNITLVVLAVAVVIGSAVIFIPWGSLFPPEPTVDVLRIQWNQIMRITNEARSGFHRHITLIEQVDENGKPYYIGELDSVLDDLLKPLVDAYNADPSTTKPLTLDELRYSLTDGIVEATAPGTKESAFYAFLCWCGTPADLVYRTDITHANGTISLAGDPVKGISNYDYIRSRDGAFSFFVYSWE